MIVFGILGSGVFVGIRDKYLNYSGGCCFLYPEAIKQHYTVKYGDVAIKHLIRKMITSGSNPNNLTAHIIGGGITSKNEFGKKNSFMAKKILTRYGIEIMSEDIGGKMGRKFIYETDTGQHITMKIHCTNRTDWFPYQ